jgi:hypothetical protein
MSAAVQSFWSGRNGLGRHFWLYFVLPIIALTGAVDVLRVLGSNAAGPRVEAILYSAAAIVALLTFLPLLRSIIQSNKGLVWKLLVAVAALFAMWSVINLTYNAVVRL